MDDVLLYECWMGDDVAPVEEVEEDANLDEEAPPVMVVVLGLLSDVGVEGIDGGIVIINDVDLCKWK